MSTEAVTPAGRRTRDALLDAGVAVAETHGLAGLSVNRVVAQADVAKGTFYVHFSDRTAFVDALHGRFHARVSDAVSVATRGLEPGAERVLRGADTYLDACLADRAIKALVMEARGDGALTDSMSERQNAFSVRAEPDFRALGWRDAAIAARLFTALTSEVAMLELEAGKKLSAARRTLRGFVGAAGLGFS
ncbi:MAG TPA: TetR/AcrR family transcriptional regulator [Solirubrobacteraceae bacterium]|nr:TetR/AcrR family transcriptional regulator [Solirubrobacteraceae bacterium]